MIDFRRTEETTPTATTPGDDGGGSKDALFCLLHTYCCSVLRSRGIYFGSNIIIFSKDPKTSKNLTAVMAGVYM